MIEIQLRLKNKPEKIVTLSENLHTILGISLFLIFPINTPGQTAVLESLLCILVFCVSSILHHLWSDMHIMILIRMSVKSSENTNQNTVTDSVINFLIWWKKLTTKST